MAIPKRSIQATCDIDAGTLVFSTVGPIFTGENAATSVEVSLTKGGSAYSPTGLLVEMYLYWPGAATMSVAVTMSVSGSTVTGNMPEVLTALPGTPLLVLQISDDINGDLIVAAAAPINITAVRGGIVVSAGAPSPSEVVYIGRSPYVDPTTHKWMEWDNNSRMYVDTGYYAASAEQIDAANTAATAANTAATAANTAATAANTAASQIDSKIENKFDGIQSELEAMVQSANGSAQTSRTYCEQSEAYAAGTKNGTPVGSTDPAYNNNSKYYAEQAHAELSGLEGEVTDLKSAINQITEVSWADGKAGYWIDNGGINNQIYDNEHDEWVTEFIPCKYGEKFIFATYVGENKIIYINRVLYGNDGFISGSRVALQDGVRMSGVTVETTIDKQDAKFISFTYRKFTTTPETHIYKLVNQNGEREKLSILSNSIPFTEGAGYIGPNGNINAGGDTTLEKHTDDYIKVNNGTKIYIDYQVTGINQNWLAYAMYDSAWNIIDRPTLHAAGYGNYHGIITISNNNVKYVRFTYRTYGNNNVLKIYFAEDGKILPQEKTKDNINGSAATYHSVRSVNHRGFNYGAPENTLPAFELSKKMGFRYVETDVRKTSDNVYVILHDVSINRTARNTDGTELSSTVNISSITYEQALTYDFGIWKSERYAGTKIPTLKEFLLLCKQIGLYAYIEIEVTSISTETDIAAILKMINECGMHNNVSLMCNTSSVLAIIRKLDDSMRIGHVRSSSNTTPYANIAALKTDYNSVFELIESSVITDSIVEECAENGVELESYLLNTEAAIESYFPKVTGIVSDFLNAQRIMSAKKGFHDVPSEPIDAPYMGEIANLNYFIYDSSRITEIIGNKIRQTRVGTGTNYGLISLVGDKGHTAGAQSEANIISIFNDGGYIDGAALNEGAKLKLHISCDAYNSESIETFGICVASYNETSETITVQFENPITPKKAMELLIQLNARIISAVNTNGNIMILFYRRSGGTTGDIMTVSWEIEGLSVE